MCLFASAAVRHSHRSDADLAVGMILIPSSVLVLTVYGIMLVGSWSSDVWDEARGDISKKIREVMGGAPAPAGVVLEQL